MPKPTLTLLYESLFSLPSINSYLTSDFLKDILTVTLGETPGEILSIQTLTWLANELSNLPSIIILSLTTLSSPCNPRY